MSRFIVVAPLRPRARAAAQALLADGPPFDPAATTLERHEIFVTDHEVVFVFEGPEAREAVQKLAGDPGVWRAAAAWRDLLSGRPRIAEDGYSWARAVPPR